jgi:hypothetical protein
VFLAEPSKSAFLDANLARRGCFPSLLISRSRHKVHDMVRLQIESRVRGLIAHSGTNVYISFAIVFVSEKKDKELFFLLSVGELSLS